MATGTSLFLIAIGAILAFAVSYEAQGVDINTIGVILMVVGVIGLLFSSLFLASYAPFRSREVHYDGPRDHTHDHV
jgi:hypothetical protein